MLTGLRLLALVIYTPIPIVAFIGAGMWDMFSELRACGRHIWNQWRIEYGSLKDHGRTMLRWAVNPRGEDLSKEQSS